MVATSFEYTGTAETYTVPEGIRQLLVEAVGGRGGEEVRSVVNVLAGEQLTVAVGVTECGGASQVAAGPIRLVVASGGGWSAEALDSYVINGASRTLIAAARDGGSGSVRLTPFA